MKSVVLAVGLLLMAAPAAADDPKNEEAKELVREGAELARDGKHAQAIEKFQEAEALVPRASHHCNIGLAYSEMGALAKAHFFLVRCQLRAVGERTRLPGWVSSQVRKTRKRLERGDYGRVRLDVQPATAEVVVRSFLPDETLDECRELWLPVGAHLLEVTAGPVSRQLAFRVEKREELVSVPINLIATGSGPDPDPDPDPDPARPSPRPRTRPWVVALVPTLGMAGSIEETVTLDGQSASGKDDLLVSPGVALKVERAVFDYLSLGLSVGASFYRTETAETNDIGYDTTLRIDAVVRGHMPIGWRGEVYLAIPVGVSVLFSSEDWAPAFVAASKQSPDVPELREVVLGTGVGFNVSVMVGTQWLIVGPFAMFFELGWVHESVTYDQHYETVDGATADSETEARTSQFGMNFGFVLAF